MSQDRKTQRMGNNSTDRRIAAFQSATTDVLVPPGFDFTGEEAATLWRTFTAARSREDWLPHDLIMVCKLVQLELDIRQARLNLAEQGFVVMNERGTMVENAWLRAFDTLSRMQLAVIRSLSMNSSASEKAIVQKSAKQDQQALKTIKEIGVESLLAVPN